MCMHIASHVCACDMYVHHMCVPATGPLITAHWLCVFLKHAFVCFLRRVCMHVRENLRQLAWSSSLAKAVKKRPS